MKSVYTNVQNGVNIFEDLCVSGGILNAFSAVHDHTLSYIDEDNAVMHYAYCTGSITCAYKTYEEHLFSAEETDYVCVGCDFYSDLIP